MKKAEIPTNIIRYSWDQNWTDQIVHNIPIAKVAQELSEIREVYGEITPQILIDSSRNKKSVFHHHFEWDNEKAANNFRLQRASQILGHIEVKIIKDGRPIAINPIAIKSISSDIGGKRPYVKLQDKVSEDSDAPLVKRGVVNDLKIIVRRLERLNTPNEVIEYLKSAIEQLSKTDDVQGYGMAS